LRLPLRETSLEKRAGDVTASRPFTFPALVKFCFHIVSSIPKSLRRDLQIGRHGLGKFQECSRRLPHRSLLIVSESLACVTALRPLPKSLRSRPCQKEIASSSSYQPREAKGLRLIAKPRYRFELPQGSLAPLRLDREHPQSDDEGLLVSYTQDSLACANINEPVKESSSPINFFYSFYSSEILPLSEQFPACASYLALRRGHDRPSDHPTDLAPPPQDFSRVYPLRLSEMPPDLHLLP